MEQLWDKNEVAAYLKYEPAYIYQLAHKREIPHYKRKGKLLFNKSEIDAWLESYRVPIKSKTQKRRLQSCHVLRTDV